jgi:hypothetical protein
MPASQAQQSDESRRINLKESWEVDYWCEKFQCSEPELRDAIKVAGDSVAALKHYFKENRLTEE